MAEKSYAMAEKSYAITVVFDSKEDAEWFDRHLGELAGFGDGEAVSEFKGNWGSAVVLDEDSYEESEKGYVEE